MKGPFSSTAGRTAATKARLDTLCLETPLQLVSLPGTLLILTSLSSPPMPGSHQGPGTVVGKEGLSQQPEGCDRSAEGQGQPLPSAHSFKTRGAAGGGIVEQRGDCPAPPLWRGPQGKGHWGHRDAGQIAHPGGPEYALHSADGAQLGGNAPAPRTPLRATQHGFVPCGSLQGLRREGGTAPSGERDRWFCVPCLLSANQPYVGKRAFTPISESSGGGGGLCFGPQGSF